MFSAVVSRLIILVFGTLYPAYSSYKAVKTKNVKEYVKWMMYWIVFALFTCFETFTDVFLCWFPFYYELKIIIVLWLLSPATKGSSILYRKFVHPLLSRREQEIDEYLNKAKEQGYHTVLQLGTQGVNFAAAVIMQSAIKNLNLPTNVPITSSQSDSSLSQHQNKDEVDSGKKRSVSLSQVDDTPEISDDDQPLIEPEVTKRRQVRGTKATKKPKSQTQKRVSRNKTAGVTTEDSDN